MVTINKIKKENEIKLYILNLYIPTIIERIKIKITPVARLILIKLNGNISISPNAEKIEYIG